jgi:hypothetical protein
VDRIEGWGGIALFMNNDEGSSGGSGIAGGSETVDDDVLWGYVEMALDSIQDDVAHASRGTAWPTDPTVEGPLPRPWVKVTHDVLSFGYGSHTFGPDIELNQISV